MPPPRIPKPILALAATAALVAGAAGAVLGTGAAWLVDSLADGRPVWRLGTIEVEGVSGGWLGALRAERVTLADADGVWIEANNVALDWRPFALLSGEVSLDSAHADTIRMLRRPALSERRRGDARLDVNIAAIAVDRLELAEPVAGQSAAFRTALALGVRDAKLDFIDLALERTDADTDRAIVLFDTREGYDLAASITGEAGGVFSALAGAPDESIALAATGDGDRQNGGATLLGLIGETELVRGETRWTPAGWNASAHAALNRLPALRTLARRIGEDLTLTAEGAHAGAFSARGATPFIEAELNGQLDADFALLGPARIVATTERLSDIAREAPFSFGPARIEGELAYVNDVLGLRVEAEARELDVLGRRTTMRGPIEATLSNERFTLTADLAAPDDAPALFAHARLRSAMRYDRMRGRYELDRSTLEGDALAIDVQGWVNDGDGEFAGQWRLKQFGALFSGMTGGASGRFRAFAEPEGEDARVWVTSVDGVGEAIAGEPAIAPQMLGARPRFDGLFRYERGGVTVSHARIDGAQARLGATGRIVRGDANLALEMTARGPLALGEAEILGAADATGRLTGPLAHPTLTADAQLSSFAAAGVVVAQPRVRFTLAPDGRAYRGRAQATGAVSNQAVDASADIAIRDSALALDALVGQVGALEVRGEALIAARGVSADLALSGRIDDLAAGATGALTGVVTLTPDRLTLDADLNAARFGDLRLRRAQMEAAGPLDSITARFALDGALGRAPLNFAGAARIGVHDDGADAQITGDGAFAGAVLATRTPATLQFGDIGREGAFDLALGDGAVRGLWRERGRALSGEAEVENAPLAPIATIWNERASGRIDGRIALASAGAGLSGQGDLTLTGARFSGRQNGAIDVHLVGELESDRLRADIDARSADGLVARFEAEAPVMTSAAPLRTALVRERRGHATWSVSGPADALWAATRLQDQALSGHIQGEGELAFGAGYLAGDGAIEIIDGRFEDKLTGATLVDLDARISVGGSGVAIDRFSAAGLRGGRLTASGGSANPREGRIAVTLDDIWLVDRPDARARGSGELVLAWEGLDATIGGQLALAEADLDIAQSPAAGIPTLDVVEINRPDADWLSTEQQAPSARAQATAIDVRVTAPGRVFTRGRGLDAEWSLDLRLDGTAAAPNVFGEAEVVRGQLALSGQPFEIERGRLRFNGDPLQADVDVLAERATADLTARIAISGPAADPEITLTSDPALPEDEILPQVLFGRSVEDLSPFEAAQIAAALANLSGRASFDLVNVARAAAGLDRFNVRQDEDGGVLVAGGVYLTRDVYVEVARTGLGQAATRVEWTVRPRLVLITSFLGNNDQRVSLRWRRESD